MPPSLETIGRWLVMIGLAVAVVGGLIVIIARLTGWEKFPGTLRFQSGNLTCLVPILGSILISILLTVLLNIIVRFLNR